jgi:hypothetical protein
MREKTTWNFSCRGGNLEEGIEPRILRTYCRLLYSLGHNEGSSRRTQTVLEYKQIPFRKAQN